MYIKNPKNKKINTTIQLEVRLFTKFGFESSFLR